MVELVQPQQLHQALVVQQILVAVAVVAVLTLRKLGVLGALVWSFLLDLDLLQVQATHLLLIAVPAK